MTWPNIFFIHHCIPDIKGVASIFWHQYLRLKAFKNETKHSNGSSYLCQWLGWQWRWHAANGWSSQVRSRKSSASEECSVIYRMTQTTLDRPCVQRTDTGAYHDMECEPLQWPEHNQPTNHTAMTMTIMTITARRNIYLLVRYVTNCYTRLLYFTLLTNLKVQVKQHVCVSVCVQTTTMELNGLSRRCGWSFECKQSSGVPCITTGVTCSPQTCPLPFTFWGLLCPSHYTN